MTATVQTQTEQPEASVAPVLPDENLLEPQSGQDAQVDQRVHDFLSSIDTSRRTSRGKSEFRVPLTPAELAFLIDCTQDMGTREALKKRGQYAFTTIARSAPPIGDEPAAYIYVSEFPYMVPMRDGRHQLVLDYKDALYAFSMSQHLINRYTPDGFEPREAIELDQEWADRQMALKQERRARWQNR